jgi:hypothetical protein
MEMLKPLCEITAADPRHVKGHSIAAEIPDEYQPASLADLHQEMVRLALPDSVPEGTRSAFDVARTLWVYGWYYWAFHTVAEYEAVRCVEMALRAKCEAEGAYDPNPKSRRNRERIGMAGLFGIALEREWVRDTGFQNFHRLQAGEARFSLPPGTIRSESQRRRLSDDPMSYTRRVFESLRYMRNWRFHPDHHSHTMPENARRTMELAFDLIRQLFPNASPSATYGRTE